MLHIEKLPDGFSLFAGTTELLRHTSALPLLSVARADFQYRGRGGQYPVRQRVEDWTPLAGFEIAADTIRLYQGAVSVFLRLEESEAGFGCDLHLPEGFNYARLNLPARPDEAVYGGGVQFSYLNLRGRKFPIWVNQAGIGRDRRRLVTLLADLAAGAGGDYWTTYYPQPAFLSGRGAGYWLESDHYALLDFRSRDHHALEFYGGARLYGYAAPSLIGLLQAQAKRAGIQPAPPAWVFEGAILGIQGGLPYVGAVLDRLLEAGAALTGVWTQDWQGVRMTPTGKRLLWNWQVDDRLYPRLEEEIQKRERQGVRWLGYLNPYFNVQGDLYPLARRRGYLALNASGGTDFRHISEFTVGILDLTSPAAFAWYKGLIQRNLLALGLRGWMADFGEDVPEGARFADGRAGKDLHNSYPRLWARLNREAVEEAGLQDETLIFHRSGYLGQNRYSNCQWAGDQLVGWDEQAGFPAAVTAGLSACMSGVQYFHSDAGGYTTLAWYRRSKELLVRWLEANVFSPVLRTHEGNRPWNNAQPWTDAEIERAFVRATRQRAALAPYLLDVSDQAQRDGTPMLRPFCLANPEPRWRSKKDAWYLGNDLLVFPCLHPGRLRMRVDIPEGEWMHLFTDQGYGPGTYVVACPPGYPAVFFRQGSAFQSTFEQVAAAG